MVRFSRSLAVVWLVCVVAVPRLASAQEPPEAAAEEPGVPGFFRMDADKYGLQLWAGATHSIGEVQIYSDVVLNGALGQVDVGPQVVVGDLTLLLTVAPVFDFATQDVAAVVAPFLTTIFDHPRFYLESWFLITFQSPFTDDAEDVIHTRNFALYKLDRTFWIGPQLELDYGLAEAHEVTSLPIGGQLSAGYGKDNRVSLFLGYETREQSDPATGEPVNSDRLAGRITFVRLW